MAAQRLDHLRFGFPELILVVTLLCISLVVVVFGNRQTEYRAKAYQQAANGVRIEAEEMSLSGGVVVSQDRTAIQF